MVRIKHTKCRGKSYAVYSNTHKGGTMTLPFLRYCPKCVVVFRTFSAETQAKIAELRGAVMLLERTGQEEL